MDKEILLFLILIGSVIFMIIGAFIFLFSCGYKGMGFIIVIIGFLSAFQSIENIKPYESKIIMEKFEKKLSNKDYLELEERIKDMNEKEKFDFLSKLRNRYDEKIEAEKIDESHIFIDKLINSIE